MDAKTQRIVLRDVEKADLPALFEHQLEPEALRMAAFPARDQDAFVQHWAKVLGDDTVIKKVILFEDRVVGNIVCFDHVSRREIGYWIERSYWGRGIATTALARFLDEVRERPLCAHVAKHNVASRRVLEKCGFEITGEDRFVDPAGAHQEEFILTLNA